MELEQLGRPQTKSTRDKISDAMKGKQNPAWKDGRRAYRRIAGAKDNDGTLIHHKDGDSKNNSRSNLQKIPESQRSKHEKIHQRHLNLQKRTGGRKTPPRGYQAKRLLK